MALKFLNKKGWHTGSLRNIENVWKAEQKHEAEQRKLEELRKQIQEEREKAEFRQLQEQAGLIPKQERLDFLYESGLAVGKGSSGFQALESLPKTDAGAAASSSTSAAAAASKPEAAVPGALFEDKPQSANDAWRKLHSDPLLMIRQKEQEALARVKNNPVQMAMIRKSVVAKKDEDKKKHRAKHHKKKSRHRRHSSLENDSDSNDAALAEDKRDSQVKDSKSDKRSQMEASHLDEESNEGAFQRRKYYEKEYKDQRLKGLPSTKHQRNDDEQRSRKRYDDSQRKEYSSDHRVESGRDQRKEYSLERLVESHNKYHRNNDEQRSRKHYDDSQHKIYSSEHRVDSSHSRRKRYSSERLIEPRHDQHKKYSSEDAVEYHHNRRSHVSSSDKPQRDESNNKHRKPVKLTEEERAARLREMQMDAEVHEEQRWKRIKKAAESDAQDAIRDHASSGRNFLDAAQKSVYGAEKGGSSTIEESVRRRTHYLQGRSATESNAFRR